MQHDPLPFPIHAYQSLRSTTVQSDKTALNLSVLVRIADDAGVDDGKIGLLIFEYFVSQ